MAHRHQRILIVLAILRLVSVTNSLIVEEEFYPDVSIRGSLLSSMTFQEYDLVFITTKHMDAKNSSLIPNLGTNLFQNHQVSHLSKNTSLESYIRSSFCSGRNYGRTALFVFPDNITTFINEVMQLSKLYFEILGKNFDSRLFSFIIWPEPIRKENLMVIGETHMNALARYFRINTEFFVLFELEGTHKFIVYELYSVRNASIFQAVDLCWMSNIQDCYIFSQRFQRRRNFQHGVVKVTSVDHIWDQCVTTYKRLNGSLEFAGGISVLTLWAIQDALNFTIYAMESSGYIALLNGQLGGVGGQVFRGEADVSITLEYLLPDRIDKITPLFPLFIDRARAFFRPPVELKNFYSSPFSGSAWFALAGMALVVIGFAFILSWMGFALHHDGHWYSTESILFVPTVLSQKGWYVDPPNLAGKILLLTTMVLSLICFAAYSGSIMSSLAVQIVPGKTLKNLLAYGFRLMYYPDHKYLFGQMDDTGVGNMTNHAYDSDALAINRTTTGGYVFLTTTDIFRPLSRMLYLHERACSSVTSIPFEKAPLQNGFYVRRGSPIKDMFNIRLLVFIQAGLNSRYKQEQYEKEIIECPVAKPLEHSLDMHELTTAFIIYIIGSSIALIIILIEILWARQTK